MVPQGQTIGSFDLRSFFSFFTNHIPGSSCITWSEKINDLSTASWIFKSDWFLVPHKTPKGFGIKSKSSLTFIMARKPNRLMAEIPNSDQQHQQINCSSPEGLYMPARLHRNPFIGFYDLLLTVKPTDGENWCRFIDGADHCCLWWGFWSDAFFLEVRSRWTKANGDLQEPRDKDGRYLVSESPRSILLYLHVISSLSFLRANFSFVFCFYASELKWDFLTAVISEGPDVIQEWTSAEKKSVKLYWERSKRENLTGAVRAIPTPFVF